MEQDLGILLENNFLSFIRTLGIFFVSSVALLNFTRQGQFFSLVTLTIALILTVCVVADYFVEKSRISKLGFSPRLIIDILAYVMIIVIVLIIFIIHSVYYNISTDVKFLAEEIESVGEKISSAVRDVLSGSVNKVNINQDIGSSMAINAALAGVA